MIRDSYGLRGLGCVRSLDVGNVRVGWLVGLGCVRSMGVGGDWLLGLGDVINVRKMVGREKPRIGKRW